MVHVIAFTNLSTNNTTTPCMISLHLQLNIWCYIQCLSLVLNCLMGCFCGHYFQECVIVNIRWQRPFEHWHSNISTFKHWHSMYSWMTYSNIDMLEYANVWMSHFKHRHCFSHSYAEVQHLMVTDISLFQFSEAPTNMYDYILSWFPGHIGNIATTYKVQYS